jgi:hypothetical protein
MHPTFFDIPSPAWPETSGFSELTIAGPLGHTGRGVTQRYVHLDKALVLAADKVAEEIEQALDVAPIL